MTGARLNLGDDVLTDGSFTIEDLHTSELDVPNYVYVILALLGLLSAVVIIVACCTKQEKGGWW